MARPDPGQCTPELLSQFATLVASGRTTTDAVNIIFETTPADAGVWGKKFAEDLRTHAEKIPDPLVHQVLKKTGVLRRLAALALYAEDEETKRKALMDIAKLQAWVSDQPINVNVQTMSHQDTLKFLQQRHAELDKILREEVTAGDW